MSGKTSINNASQQYAQADRGKQEIKGLAQEEEEKMFRALSACYDDYLKGNKTLMGKIVGEMTNRQKEKELIRSWLKVSSRKLIEICKNRQDPSYLVEVILYQMPWFEAGNEFEIALQEQDSKKQYNASKEIPNSNGILSNQLENNNSQRKQLTKTLQLKKASPHFELFSEFSKFAMTVLSFNNAFAPQIIKFLVSNIVPIEIKEIDGCKKSEIEVSVDGQTFENQKKLIMFIRDSLNKYELNSISDVRELSKEDSTFLLAVLRYHPNAKEKLSKFKKLLIGQAQFDDTISRCLYIMTKDEQKVDISYVKSVQNMVDEQFYKKGLKQGSPNQKQMMIQITDLIAKITKIYPLYQVDLCRIISESYPHRVQGESFHKIFLTNTLQLAIKNPSILPKILVIVFQKLLEIDSEIKLDIMEGIDSGKTSQTMAEKLDWLMLIFFEFIDFQMKDKVGEDTCFGEIQNNPTSENEQTQEQGKFFKVFLNLFCEQVLITHQSKYVQFIIFYLCSLRIPFQKAFLNQLMNNITKKNPLLYKSTQINSIYYLGSYLARAKYVDKKSISTIFNYLLDHLTSYLAKFDEQTKEDTYNEGLHKIHQNLYHLLQAMLYVMCFRFSAVSDKDILQKFHFVLSKACSDFNALYFISPSIQSVFLDVCESFGATEFIELFESSQQGVPQSDLKSRTQIIDTYFPFDPYCLQYSDKYICEIYQNWQDFNFGDFESLDSSIRKSDDSKLAIQQTQIKPSGNNLNTSFILNQTPNLEGISANICNNSRLSKENYGFTIDKLNNINEFEYDKDNMIQDYEEEKVNASNIKIKEKHKSKKNLPVEEITENQQQEENEQHDSLESQIKAAQSKESKKLNKKRKNQISTTDNSVNTTPIANNEEDSANQHLVQAHQVVKKSHQNQQQVVEEDFSFSDKHNGSRTSKKQKMQ